jgi:hypothetical protein
LHQNSVITQDQESIKTGAEILGSNTIFFAKIKKETPSSFKTVRGVEDQGASTNKVF